MEKKSFRNYAYDYLREKILSGQFESGKKVNISSVSAELELSTAPVREALSQLQSEGLIENVPYCGPRVPNWTANDFYNNRLATVALYLGCYSMIRALGRREQLISSMEEALEAQKMLGNDASASELTTAAIRFDSCFIKVLDNSVIESMLMICTNLSYLEANSEYNAGLREHDLSVKEHVAILNAVKKDSYEELKDVLLSHLRLPNVSLNS